MHRGKPSAMSAHNGTALVVEPNANLLSVVREYLGRAGFTVLSAADGWDALKQMRERPIDAVISEFNLSDMDGSGLREKCLLNPATREVPFLFLVDAESRDEQIRALRAGVDDCLGKPFDPIVLVARVQAVLARRSAYEEMVRVDPLTRMLNRTNFENAMENELRRVARYGRPAAMVLINIDRFQQVNEESGFAMGDLLLTCLAGVIQTSIRAIDSAARLQSDSFILYLPETTGDGAVALSKRMQVQLSKIAENIAGYDLTFTCAVVAMPDHGTDYDNLMQQVHDAMMAAKKNAPGSVVLAPPNLEAATA